MQREYRVIRIDEMTRPDRDTGVKTTYRYTAETRGGTRFTAELDNPEPNAEQVHEVLKAKATELDKILAQ